MWSVFFANLARVVKGHAFIKVFSRNPNSPTKLFSSKSTKMFSPVWQDFRQGCCFLLISSRTFQSSCLPLMCHVSCKGLTSREKKAMLPSNFYQRTLRGTSSIIEFYNKATKSFKVIFMTPRGFTLVMKKSSATNATKMS